MIKIMMFWWELLLRKVGFKNIYLPLVQKGYSWFTCHVNGTRHYYELRRSDGRPKYEIWLWVMKSYIAWVNGIFTMIDPTCYQYRDFLKSCIWRSVVIGTTRMFWKHMDTTVSWQEFSFWWMIKGFWTSQNIEETCICMKLSGS